MPKGVTNIAASVRARLSNLAREKQITFDFLLTRYATERLLYRLTQSPHADQFILKGAMLLVTLIEEPFRATRDIDLLGFGDPDPESVLGKFREIAEIEGQDGIQFLTDEARIDPIREDNHYGGHRIRMRADISGARILITIDIGFGDATEPGVQMVDYPVLLDMPAPRLRGYAPETVVAEKFQAMVALGLINSRMKDYFDVWVLSRTFDFDPPRLAIAITATFARRDTQIPRETPDGLDLEFAQDPAKQQQWAAFKENVTPDPGTLLEVVADLEEFLMAAARIAREGL